MLFQVIGCATAVQKPARAAQTKSRLIALLQDDGVRTVPIGERRMRILASRGPHLAAAATAFQQEEPELLAWIDTFQPTDTFWDIGAAAGLFTMYAAIAARVRVTAFEPNATSHALLTEHLALNGLGGQVAAFNCAFSNRTALSAIDLASLLPGSGGNSLTGIAGQFGDVRPVFTQSVLVFRVDDFRRLFGVPAPSHIKIDVDGAEGEILEGATETLRSVTSIMIEVEGRNATEAASRIEAPLAAAGLQEVMEVRTSGSLRNRLYRRA